MNHHTQRNKYTYIGYVANYAKHIISIYSLSYISNTPIVCTDRHMWIVIVSVKYQPYRMKKHVIIIKYKGIPCQSKISSFLENGSLWYYWNYVES